MFYCKIEHLATTGEFFYSSDLHLYIRFKKYIQQEIYIFNSIDTVSLIGEIYNINRSLNDYRCPTSFSLSLIRLIIVGGDKDIKIDEEIDYIDHHK